jgi:hypothetical protein
MSEIYRQYISEHAQGPLKVVKQCFKHALHLR